MLHIRHSPGTDTCAFVCNASGRGAPAPAPLGEFGGEAA
jgi:hypothetical protein